MEEGSGILGAERRRFVLHTHPIDLGLGTLAATSRDEPGSGVEPDTVVTEVRIEHPEQASERTRCRGRIEIYSVLASGNAILVLMAVELMLNGVKINLVAFDVWLRDELLAGQVLTLFIITIAAAEVGIGLAVVLLVFRNRETAQLDGLQICVRNRSRDRGLRRDARALPRRGGVSRSRPAAAR